MTPLRVLHLIPAVFHPELGVIGGGERYATELARNMAEVVPTTLVGFGPRSAEWEIGRLKVRVIPASFYVRGQRQNPLSPQLLPELLNHDIIHCHQKQVMISSLSAFAGRLLGKRVFVTDHGGGGWDISGYISMDRWYAGQLHVSQFSRRIAKQADCKWAHVIYGGIDVGRFSPPDSGYAKPPGAPAVFVGRLLSHKGVNDLVTAAGVDIRLDVIGRPDDARFLSDLHRLAAGNNVKFIHDAQDADLYEAYRTALCVVLPSVYRDCYGNESQVPELLGQTLLEGMACGLPGVATQVTSLPEVVEDGLSGFIVPPNDPVTLRNRLLWLKEHPAEAEKMGEAARRRVLETFTWPVVVRRCLEIYGRA